VGYFCKCFTAQYSYVHMACVWLFSFSYFVCTCSLNTQMKREVNILTVLQELQLQNVSLISGFICDKALQCQDWRLQVQFCISIVRSVQKNALG